jgi:hypothetical protein
MTSQLCQNEGYLQPEIVLSSRVIKFLVPVFTFQGRVRIEIPTNANDSPVVIKCLVTQERI